MYKIARNLYCIKTGRQKVVLFPGNGIGPEIARSVEDIFRALDIPIEF